MQSAQKTKKQQKPKPKTKPVVKKQVPKTNKMSNQPAPRRNDKRRKNRAKRDEFKGKSDVVTITPVEGREASTTRQNIMVIANCIPKSVEAAFCALATRAYIFGAEDPNSPVYFAYVAFMLDLVQLMGSQIPGSVARLDYLNHILGTYIPKTIPFKTDSELAYSWGNLQTIQTANVITIRGYNYYFYSNDAATAGNWLTQSPPINPSVNSDAFDKLAEVYSLLAEHQPGMTFDPTHTEIDAKYREDVSGFASCAVYYGGGNGDNGPAYSCESEVPFQAPILSGVATYDQTRVARNFKLTSGDSTTAFGLPFVPGFDPIFYNTCYAPIYKFVDIDEFIYLIQKYYINLVQAYINTVESKSSAYGPALAIALSPFAQSPEAWRIYWRQIILSMFSASQACSQFITYATGPNDFEPLRVGSNCFPPNTVTPLLPTFIIENLRLLQPKMASIKTRFQNDKNALIYIPVFGVYKSVNAYNASGSFFKIDDNTNYTEYTSNICTGSETIYPRMIDGMGPNSEVLDMNGSLLEDFIAQWNLRVNTLKAASAPAAMLGGSSNGTLLTLTRYAYYNEQEIVIDKLPEWRKPFFKNKHIIERTKETKRSLSQKNIILEKEMVYVPDNYDLESQRTSAISSLHKITEEIKQLCQYMVLPSITIERNNVPPLQRQLRVLSMEGNVWDWSKKPGFGVATRINELDAFAGVCAPGLAAQGSDEVQLAIDHLNKVNAGGFVGDALTEVAKFLLPNIPF